MYASGVALCAASIRSRVDGAHSRATTMPLSSNTACHALPPLTTGPWTTHAYGLVTKDGERLFGSRVQMLLLF
jgi:hypothetical protein